MSAEFDPLAIARSLSKRELRLLYLADSSSGMYPGVQLDLAPKRFLKLRNAGLIYEFVPHNPVHKYRAVTTDKGAAVFAAARKEGLCE